jgi:hypothetical protein
MSVGGDFQYVQREYAFRKRRDRSTTESLSKVTHKSLEQRLLREAKHNRRYARTKPKPRTAHAFEATHVTYRCDERYVSCFSHPKSCAFISLHSLTFYSVSTIPLLSPFIYTFTICSLFSFRPSQLLENAYIQPMHTPTYSELQQYLVR